MLSDMKMSTKYKDNSSFYITEVLYNIVKFFV